MRHVTTFGLMLPVTVALVAFAAGDEPPSAQPDGQPVPPHVAAMMAAKKGGDRKPGDLPKFDDVADDYEKVVSTADGKRSLYTLWTREKDAQMLAELPRSFENQLLFWAYTIAGGTPTAGVQSGDTYAQWKRYDDKLALVEPNFAVRTTGDLESQKGRERVFTDRVILDVPIVAMGPGGGPVIDMDALLLGQSSKFFGFMARGANTDLRKIVKAKAFPENVEIAYELPAGNGRFMTLHYSIKALPKNTGYKPRVADERIGFFTTTYRDIGDASADTQWVRYVNRWDLEKADAKLKMSPPKNPIVFYLEHTLPVRYRRWVREGVAEWNKAYEKVGIVNAMEVYQQDARTGAHMDKDPEDARYNFVLWTNASMGFAIGPSRVDPRTGQILDADIVMDEGFITSWANAWKSVIPQQALEGFGPQTLAWLEERPQWDPRVRLASPEERPQVIVDLRRARAERHAHGLAHGGHPAATVDATLLGDDMYDGLGRMSQVNGMCMHATTRSLDVAMFRLSPELFLELAERGTADDAKAGGATPISGTWTGTVEHDMGAIPYTLRLLVDDDNTVTGTLESELYSGPVTGAWDAQKKTLAFTVEAKEGVTITFELSLENGKLIGTAAVGDESVAILAERTGDLPEPDEKTVAAEKKLDDLLDGVPEQFIGPLLKDVVMHEVGHTLGLRHNFKASTIHTLAEINTEEFKGKAQTGSVMDYNPININFGDGPVQGDYTMVTIGPYDYWAIEYGYTSEKDLKPILARVSEDELRYATDEDTWGPDPRARRFDYAADPLNYADSQMRLVQHLRTKILDRMVKDGDSWSKARQGYEILLGRHFGAVAIAANWVGGSYLNRDKKGDPGDRAPITPIEAERQRRALDFVVENTFNDAAFGLTPELLSKMTVDKWWDAGGFSRIFQDETWPIHDRISGIQAAAMTMVLNPTSLNRVYDSEWVIDRDEDALTVAEIMIGVGDSVWSELDDRPRKTHSARKPYISSLRRNLQSEHLERLIDLSFSDTGFGAARKAISNLSVYQLRQVHDKIDALLEKNESKLDPYSAAHLSEARVRIAKALDAQYIYNAGDIGGGGGMPFFFIQPDDGDGR